MEEPEKWVKMEECRPWREALVLDTYCMNSAERTVLGKKKGHAAENKTKKLFICLQMFP